MKNLIKILVCPSVYMACGKSDQEEPSGGEEASLDVAAAITVASESQRSATDSSVADISVEPVLEEINSLNVPQQTEGNSELIVPPTQVTGAYLVAEVVQDTELAIDIGFIIYQNGKRFIVSPDKFMIDWILSNSADPGVQASLQKPLSDKHDMIVSFKGESGKAIRAQFEFVKISLKLSELIMTKNATEVSKSVLEVLQMSAAGTTAGPAMSEP